MPAELHSYPTRPKQARCLVVLIVEQPEWVLSEVLLSPDLAPHILAQLPTKEHAAKGTCRAWRRGWIETLKKRERPRLVVIGGRDGEFVNSMERYDPSTNEWEEEAVAPMPTARNHVRMAVLDVLRGTKELASEQRPASAVKSGSDSAEHLEHLECSRQPHIQGR